MWRQLLKAKIIFHLTYPIILIGIFPSILVGIDSADQLAHCNISLNASIGLEGNSNSSKGR
jgi:hypothetical protein